jgi:hypothetical protein
MLSSLFVIVMKCGLSGRAAELKELVNNPIKYFLMNEYINLSVASKLLPIIANQIQNYTEFWVRDFRIVPISLI